MARECSLFMVFVFVVEYLIVLIKRVNPKGPGTQIIGMYGPNTIILMVFGP